MWKSPVSTPSTRAARWLAVGAATGLLIAAAAPSFSSHTALAVDPTTPEHTITVTGIGRVILTPDVADLRLGVNITRPTATQARADAAAAMTKVVDAIKKAGIADKDIQTSTLSLQPVYDYSNNGQGKLTGLPGHEHRLRSRSHDVVEGRRPRGCGGRGRRHVRGWRDVPGRGRDEGRGAGADRRGGRREGQGRRPGGRGRRDDRGVSSISETSSGMPYPMPYAAAAPAKDAMSTPVQPGHDRDRHHGDRRLPDPLTSEARTRRPGGLRAPGRSTVAATICGDRPRPDVGHVELASLVLAERGDVAARLEQERHRLAAAAARRRGCARSSSRRTGTSPRGPGMAVPR